jgi:transcriptional regulator with XRE-family HTH domain
VKINVRHHRLNVVGLSIEDFACKVGVTPDVIRNLEETGNRPRPANAVKVARYFEMEPDEMWSTEAQVEDPTSEAAA